ncbi:MAG: FTR1 family protein, partial [Anaerolineae bacterium]|nr:FTR1 family protein [Anaerolineae bacterium]
RTLKSEIESELQVALNAENGRGLFAVTFFAVAREGVETALLLSAAAFSVDAVATLSGAVLGLAVSVGLGLALYLSTVRLNIRMFFNVTSV